MSVLVLRLAGPLQSWGDDSRYERRETRREPSKSGVLGLLAAAQGRRRTDPVEDLMNLRFGVRVDQPGTVLTDYQTVHVNGYEKPPKLTYRQYVADAAFVAAVEGDKTLINSLAEAIQQPAFIPFLGRRSCPVEGQILLGVESSDVRTALDKQAWVASAWHRQRQPTRVTLDAFADAEPGEPAERRHDNPGSFASDDRRYAVRSVARFT
ncbi:MAG: type I-E CRISPR-associated protein Cas5/CasD, partial [Propionibacteriales bacterium]|nr:type I-E CRISPR-associated protein Cas5/CasD [Propionibacteriales bacterium]